MRTTPSSASPAAPLATIADHPVTGRISSPSRPFLILLAYAALLHAALLAYDLAHPEVFLRADRAVTRMAAIDTLAELIRQGAPLGEFFSSHGVVGDYLPQALVYLAGGRTAVILGQVLLFLISLAALLSLTLGLTRSRNCALAAGLLYLHLPHSLVFPHTLCAEAIFDPLVVISFCFMGRAMLNDGEGAAAAWSGLALGLATLVRPITALWPLPAACAMRLGRRTWGRVASFVTLSCLPAVIAMSIMLGLSGAFSLGSSDHDLGHNLYLRVKFISVRLAPTEQVRVRETYLGGRGADAEVVSVPDFLRFVTEYPASYLAHFGNDGLIFFAKSGFERLMLDYLDVDPSARVRLQDRQSGFRRQLDRNGALQTSQRMLREHPLLTLGAALASLAFLAMVVLAAVGAWRVLVDHALPNETRLMLGLVAAFPLYLFAVSQSISAVQSRHRAVAEFAFCLLAAIGLRFLAHAVRSTRHGGRGHGNRRSALALVAGMVAVHLPEPGLREQVSRAAGHAAGREGGREG